MVDVRRRAKQSHFQREGIKMSRDPMFRMALTISILAALAVIVLLCSCAKTDKAQLSVISIHGGGPYQSDVRNHGEYDVDEKDVDADRDSLEAYPDDDSFYEDEAKVVFKSQMGSGVALVHEYRAHVTTYRVTFTCADGDTPIAIPVREGALNVVVPVGLEIEGSIVLVRAIDKQNLLVPLLSRVETVGGHTYYVQDELAAVAKIEFFGYEELTDAPLYTVGTLDVHFADWFPENPESGESGP
jgi:hypothetical protein